MNFICSHLQQVPALKAGPWGPFLPTTGPWVQGLGRDRGAGGTLTSVDDDVLGQVTHIHEGFAAHAALVRTDIVVVANVIGQLAGLDKSAGHRERGLH